MKKEYVSPSLDVVVLNPIQLLTGSGHGIYGKLGDENLNIGYGGVVDEDEEDEIDPD